MIAFALYFPKSCELDKLKEGLKIEIHVGKIH